MAPYPEYQIAVYYSNVTSSSASGPAYAGNFSACWEPEPKNRIAERDAKSASILQSFLDGLRNRLNLSAIVRREPASRKPFIERFWPNWATACYCPTKLA